VAVRCCDRLHILNSILCRLAFFGNGEWMCPALAFDGLIANFKKPNVAP